MMEGENSITMYCKDFCKCYPRYSNNEKRKKYIKPPRQGKRKKNMGKPLKHSSPSQAAWSLSLSPCTRWLHIVMGGEPSLLACLHVNTQATETTDRRTDISINLQMSPV
jgi:hypothetical protein